MMRRALRSESGMTYIAVLVMVVITGIMAAQGAIVWKTAMQREREEELLSRGTQIRDALRRWYRVKVVPGKETVEPDVAPGQQVTPVPNLPELKALLLDPNSLQKKRYLRPYCLIDPMTGKDWDLIRDGGKIVGVKSTSEKEPIKQGKGAFPIDLHPGDFENKKKYSEWEFRYNRVPPIVTKNGGGGDGLPRSQPTPQPPPTPDNP